MWINTYCRFTEKTQNRTSIPTLFIIGLPWVPLHHIYIYIFILASADRRCQCLNRKLVNSIIVEDDDCGQRWHEGKPKTEKCLINFQRSQRSWIRAVRSTLKPFHTSSNQPHFTEEMQILVDEWRFQTVTDQLYKNPTIQR